MKFRSWLSETETHLGNQLQNNLSPVNKGSATPGSDEVLRTGLQPQVDSHEIKTHEKDEQDAILAFDGKLKRVDVELFSGGKFNTPKINKIKTLWEKFKEKWEEIKLDSGIKSPADDTAKDNNQMTQQQPTMMPVGAGHTPTGSETENY